jgi:hypothetical protein
VKVNIRNEMAQSERHLPIGLCFEARGTSLTV